jgi:hypothetical protein
MKQPQNRSFVCGIVLVTMEKKSNELRDKEGFWIIVIFLFSKH